MECSIENASILIRSPIDSFRALKTQKKKRKRHCFVNTIQLVLFNFTICDNPEKLCRKAFTNKMELTLVQLK